MPWDRLAEADDRGDGLARLAVRENARTLPLGAVWDEFCRRSDVPPGMDFRAPVGRYESDVLRRRI